MFGNSRTLVLAVTDPQNLGAEPYVSSIGNWAICFPHICGDVFLKNGKLIEDTYFTIFVVVLTTSELAVSEARPLTGVGKGLLSVSIDYHKGKLLVNADWHEFSDQAARNVIYSRPKPQQENAWNLYFEIRDEVERLGDEYRSIQAYGELDSYDE